MSGRERLKVALELKMETVSATERPAEEAAGIILCELVARKHYTASGRAYLAYPLLEPMLAAGRERKTKILKAGEHSAQRALCGKTVGELAHEIGIGRRLIFYAQRIHKIFGQRPSLKATWEPRILANEHPTAISLGALLAGVAGQDATAGKSRQDYGQMELFSKLTDTLVVRFKKFGNLAEGDRVKVAAAFASTVEDWPVEVLAAVDMALEKRRAQG
jgi:hypothetical protein